MGNTALGYLSTFYIIQSGDQTLDVTVKMLQKQITRGILHVSHANLVKSTRSGNILKFHTRSDIISSPNIMQDNRETESPILKFLILYVNFHPKLASRTSAPNSSGIRNSLSLCYENVLCFTFKCIQINKIQLPQISQNIPRNW